MGSWSEACGFSGLEIGEGDVAYVAIIGKGPYHDLNAGSFMDWQPLTTLVRGTYNDYGYLRIDEDQAVLDLFNQQADLSLKNGDDFSIDHMEGRAGFHRWWIHGQAFDFLPSITPEFPYARDPNSKEYKSVRIKDIREATDMHIAKLREVLVATQAKVAEAKLVEDEQLRAVKMVLAIDGLGMRDVLGYRDTPGMTQDQREAVLEHGAPIEPLLTSYSRIFMLQYAMTELRKVLHPCESVGPQHGGHVALRQFAKFLVGACDLSLAEYEDAAGE